MFLYGLFWLTGSWWLAALVVVPLFALAHPVARWALMPREGRPSLLRVLREDAFKTVLLLLPGALFSFVFAVYVPADGVGLGLLKTWLADYSGQIIRERTAELIRNHVALRRK
jgi:hypothetical protein